MYVTIYHVCVWSTQGELMCTKQALDTEREAHHTSRRKTVKELASTK